MRRVVINGNDVSDFKWYDFDGCHKFYLYKSKTDARKNFAAMYGDHPKSFVDGLVKELKPIQTIPGDFYNSCPLRFIDKITGYGDTEKIDTVVQQCEEVVTFEIGDKKYIASFKASDDSLKTFDL